MTDKKRISIDKCMESGICLACRERPMRANSGDKPFLMCWQCSMAKLKEIHERKALLSRQPRMTWEDFVVFLQRYEFMAGLDYSWSREAYEKYGRHLPKEAAIGDCPEFEFVFTEHVCNGHPAYFGEIYDGD